MGVQKYFYFNGGVDNRTEEETNKFLVFVVLNDGKEIFLHEAMKLGFVRRCQREDNQTVTALCGLSPIPKTGIYATDLSTIKVFNYQFSTNKPRKMFSVYVRLGESHKHDGIEIRHFSDQSGAYNFKFLAFGRLVPKKEMLSGLPEGSTSKKMLSMQQTPSLEVLRRIIIIHRPYEKQIRRAVRKLRM